MDAHSQEDLLADAAREGEAPKLRHLLRKAFEPGHVHFIQIQRNRCS